MRFGELLERALASRNLAVQVIRPRQIAGRLLRRVVFAGWGRWLGYVDKYVVFPKELYRHVPAAARQGPTVVQIVDHLNAVYVPQRTSVP